MIYKSCLDKQNAVKEMFSLQQSMEEKYQKLIELGKQRSRFDPIYKIPENVVPGCQSVMYLRAYSNQGLIYFEADSEALISAGLAAILLLVYSGEMPEAVLKCPPNYIDELGIKASLTPSRANGLSSIYLRMKQEALKTIIKGSVSL